MPSITEQYSSAARQAGSAVEKTADLWARGMREFLDRTSTLPRLPQVDLVPAVERYFDVVQRAVELNRELTIRFVQAAGALPTAVRERAESAGDVIRERTATVEQVSREQAANAAKAAREQAEKAERADQELAREARRVEREQARKAHQKARERYAGLTKAELSDLLAKRDLPKSGNVDDLIERLVEADGK
ncbi:MAG: SAP domain-containing protein [Streptosporangiaceae bacterium]